MFSLIFSENVRKKIELAPSRRSQTSARKTACEKIKKIISSQAVFRAAPQLTERLEEATNLPPVCLII